MKEYISTTEKKINEHDGLLAAIDYRNNLTGRQFSRDNRGNFRGSVGCYTYNNQNQNYGRCMHSYQNNGSRMPNNDGYSYNSQNTTGRQNQNQYDKIYCHKCNGINHYAKKCLSGNF